MATHGPTDTRANRFLFEISLDGIDLFRGSAEEIYIIKCGGHVAVIWLFECVYEHEIARQAHDDNVSSLAATSQRKTAPRPLADEKLFFCSPDSGHECELCFLFYFFESEYKRRKKTTFYKRSKRKYLLLSKKRKRNDDKKQNQKNTATGRQAPAEQKQTAQWIWMCIHEKRI